MCAGGSAKNCNEKTRSSLLGLWNKVYTHNASKVKQINLSDLFKAGPNSE